MTSATPHNLAGYRFGLLTAIAPADRVAAGDRLLPAWRCRCDCGSEKVVVAQALRAGKTRSCGCASRKWTVEKRRKHGGASKGAPVERWYTAWSRMMRSHRRVSVPVDPAWNNAATFLSDMGAPAVGQRLMRRDPSQAFDKSNCFWGAPAAKPPKVPSTPGARYVDLSGQRFGMLTALAHAGRNSHGHTLWRCQCDCGQNCVAPAGSLRQGTIVSCGCWRKRMLPERNLRHGGSESRWYRAWSHMQTRCTNPNFPGWEWYGGRGIKVCARWSDAALFHEDMGDPPPGTSLDRIDVNGHYEPGNCRWATATEQARNRRATIYVEHEGTRATLMEWAERTGVKYGTLVYRFRRGMQPPQLFRTPL